MAAPTLGLIAHEEFESAATSFETAAYEVAASEPVFVSVMGAMADVSTVPTLSGPGGTYSLVEDTADSQDGTIQTDSGTERRRVAVFCCANPSNATDTFIADFGADSQTHCYITISQTTGGNTSTPYKQVDVAAGNSFGAQTTNFTAAVDAGNSVLAAVAINNNAGLTPGGGYNTLADDVTAAGGNSSWLVEWDDTADQSVDWTIDGATNRRYAAVIVEVVAAGGVNATASPATVAATAAIPSATASGTGVASPSTVAAVGAVPQATAVGTSGDATAEPDTVAAVAAVPGATGQGGGIGSPGTVAAVAAVPSATGQGAGVASPSTVAAVAAVPSATATGTAIASPSTVVAVAAVPQATGQGGGIASPGTVIAVAAVPQATAAGTVFIGVGRAVGLVTVAHLAEVSLARAHRAAVVSTVAHSAEVSAARAHRAVPVETQAHEAVGSVDIVG